MNTPSPEQLAAMRRIHLAITHNYNQVQKINAAINEFNLESDLGIKRLPTSYLGLTLGDIAANLPCADLYVIAA